MTDAPAPSCFIAGTHCQFAFDSTSIGYFKTCPRLYYYQMILGYTTRSFHLSFGSWVHSALETYEKARAAGADHEGSLEAAVQYTLLASWDETSDAPWDSGDPNKNRSTLLRTVIWYLDQFGASDPCETLILANGLPAVELSFTLELDKLAPNGERYLLCGHLDRIVRFGGELYVMDTKTTKSTLSSTFFNTFNPDNQMSLYSIAAEMHYNTPVRGVIINAMQILVGETRFARPITTRTRAQSDEWLNDLDVMLDEAARSAETGHWRMNDKACRICSFRSVCAADPSLREGMLAAQFEKRAWNPLEKR